MNKEKWTFPPEPELSKSTRAGIQDLQRLRPREGSGEVRAGLPRGAGL